MQFSREVGSLEDVMQYLNANPILFEKDESQNGYIERVMTVLTQQNMELLQKQFQLYPRGLQLPTFIYLMKQIYVPEHEMAKYFFISDLIKFFQAIDINGDGHLQWSQFTQYIIENIRIVQKPKYTNKVFEQNQIISTAFSKLSNEYRITKVYDLGYHTLIKKIIYLNYTNQYYIIESQCHQIKIFNRKLILQDSIVLQSNNNKSTIIDFSIDKENCVIGCIFQESLYFCNMKIRTTVNFVNQHSQINYKQFNKIQYLRKHELWAIASKSGEIQLAAVHYSSRTIMSFQTIKILKYHESIITEIAEIDEPFFIASSSMDGFIKLYSKQLDKQYTVEHVMDQVPSAINERKKKGVLGLSYSREFGNYLLSFGFSNCICIHSLDISITKGYTGRYTEHTGTILWSKFLKSSPHVLSFDDRLNLRIWDFRKFNTIQFINCQRTFINPSRLQIIPESSQILICEKKIVQFKSAILQQKSRQINEFHNIFDIKFNQVNNQLFVFTSNDVRVYSFYTGSLKKLFTKLYENNCQTNITACQFGFKCRRFFVGDAGGFVREFCSQTGEQLQNINPGDQFQYENKQIAKIIFLKEHSVLICCSVDSRIMIYERDENGEFVIIRDIRQSHEELACAALSSRYCLFATAGEDGVIVLWNLEKYALESVNVVKSKPIGIAFSSIHPVMIVATEDGYLNLFYVSPFDGKQRNKCFAKIYIGEKTDDQHQIKITSFCSQLIVNAYFPPKCQLSNRSKGKHHLIVAIGAQNGNIYVLNLNRILQIYSIEQNHQINSIKNCHRCQVQVMKNAILKQKNKVLSNGFSNNIEKIHYLSQFIHLIIKASDGPIENILISKECSSIFCKSVDKKLKVFSFKNQYNGAINFSTFKKIFWKIPQINFHKKLQLINNTIYSIKLIESKKFKPQQQNKIKIHLLLNEYLNTKQKQQYLTWLTTKNTTNNQQLLPITKSRYKKQENNDQMSELEFNQIYLKLKNSIERSLEDYNNYQKIYQEKKKQGCKGKNLKMNQSNLEKFDQNDDHCDENSKKQLLDGRMRKKQIQSSFKIRNKTFTKFNSHFELFGKKKQKSKEKLKVVRRNLLYIPLSIAKKTIMEGRSFGSFR